MAKKAKVYMSDIYGFKERRFCAFRHRIKVFIFGVDVSPWLRGTVNIVYGNRDSFNTANLEISNPHRIWQLTKQNLDDPNKNGFRLGSGEYSEFAKRRVFALKNQINQEYSLKTTLASFGNIRTAPTSINSSGNIEFKPPAEDAELKYRFSINDCIFNKHDPIRIFVQNPFSAASDEWLEVFCGFVQDHPITTDYFNGNSFVRISAYCIRHMMTKMRVQANALQSQNTGDIFFNAGFFADFKKPTQLSQPFANASLQTAIKELILGNSIGDGFDKSAPDSSATKDNQAVKQRGVGEFALGNVVCYDPKKPGNALERWHLMTVFGCNKVPFPEENTQKNNLWLSTKQVNALGENTIWHPSKKYRGPDARYLHMLLPIDGTGPSALITSTVAVSISSAEFTTRWEIIKNLADKLDFQVMTSPSGDILVEFPMYGFSPSAFSPIGANQDYDSPKAKVGLANIFSFRHHQKEETLNDEGEDFPTVLMVSGGMANEHNNVKDSDAVPTARSFIYSPALASRYGVIVEQVDYPFAGQTAGDLSGSLVSRLSRLGMIEYTKRLANSSTWEGSLAYRPFLFPNRPVHLKRSNRIGNITSVSYSWNLGKDAGVSLSLNNLMAERYNPETKKSTFRLLTGALNTPISYAKLWGTEGDKETGEAAAEPNSGVFSDATNNVGTTEGTDPGSPETPQSPGQVREKISNPSVVTGLDKLYPKFRSLVVQLIEGCAAEGIKISVRESYRSPERQQAIFNVAKGTGTNAEAFQSWHQYGLAVDVAPVVDKSAGISNDREAFARINDVNVRLGLNMRWGGNFRSFYDGWHFEKPVSWINLKTAMGIAQKYGTATYLQEVWKHLDMTLGGGQSSFDPNNMPVETGTGAVPGNPGAALPVAASCEPHVLTAAGFDNLLEDPE